MENVPEKPPFIRALRANSISYSFLLAIAALLPVLDYGVIGLDPGPQRHQRLGLPDDQYLALLSQNELEIKALQDEIRADIVRFERAAPEKRHDIKMTGLQKLEKLEDVLLQEVLDVEEVVNDYSQTMDYNEQKVKTLRE